MESISHLYHSEVEARLLLITVRCWSFVISDRGLAILLGGGGGGGGGGSFSDKGELHEGHFNNYHNDAIDWQTL